MEKPSTSNCGYCKTYILVPDILCPVTGRFIHLYVDKITEKVGISMIDEVTNIPPTP